MQLFYYGRSWTLMDGYFSEDRNILRTLMDAHFSKDGHGRWVDAQPTFEVAGKNWSRDGCGHAFKS